jgi:hypothetical protein
LVCAEGIFEIKAITNLLVPENNKTILVFKCQTTPKNTGIYYINCHGTNHNVETCKVKRKENLVPIVFEVSIQHIKV